MSADVYMHNPRGANDRNCERNVNRNNGNLLYDTQNNAKGGYACPRAVAGSNAVNAVTPKMEYEVGSLLEVEWTAQHGCGQQKEVIESLPPNLNTATSADDLKKARAETPNVHCEIVIEMMCTSTTDPKQTYKSTANTRLSKLVAAPREGIPNNDNDAATNRINTQDPGQADATNTNNARFGVHETPEFYNECNRVQRNRGLFTADQNVNRRSAIGTRQNPNGGRRGLECPEERDYYPYWRPSPFMGVAYLVDDPARCGSATGANLPCGGSPTNPICGTPANALKGDWIGNAQGYNTPTGPVMHGSCVLESTGKVPKTNANLPTTRVAINNAQRSARDLYNRREWPNNQADCDKIAATAAGNNEKPKWQTLMFNPSFETAKYTTTVATAQQGTLCDTIDYSRSNHLGNSGGADTATRFTMTIPNVNEATVRQQGGTTLPGEPCLLRLRYNMSSSDYVRNLTSASNGNDSPIQQDPLVKVGPAASDVVQLALNTNQVARTFQDRSYVFYVVPQKGARTGEQVVNVNIRGKRGNIVQTYPAVEYDFIPNTLEAVACGANAVNCKNTVMAVQWTGSDYNPRRGCNDGEGGPYTGDNNVINRLNQQGSNQNSRTDRMTVLAIGAQRDNYPAVTGTGNNVKLPSGIANTIFKDEAQALKFAQADAKAQLAARNVQCLTATQINNINNENRRENHPRNCAEGNALSPYFSTEEIKVQTSWIGKTQGFYSARNNNFSNRDSKMLIMTSNPKVGGTSVPIQTTPSIPGLAPIADLEVQAVPNAPTYNKETGSYDSEAAIEANADVDIPGFDPVENDDYGEGALEGCTQDLMYFAGAQSGQQISLALMGVLFLLY